MAVPVGDHALDVPGDHLLSAYLFLRGHDLPGGGFAAGIALAIAFLLQYLGTNVREVEDRLRILPVRWIGLGLLVAAGTGMGAWLFGYPFLTSHARYLDLPLVGRMPFATALLFDLGVYLLVVGATVLILVASPTSRCARAAPPPAGTPPQEEAGRWKRCSRSPSACSSAPASGCCCAAHLPGDHRPGAALLWRQPLHLRDGPAPRRRRADPRQSGLVDAAAYADPVPQALVLPPSSSASPRPRFSWW